MALPKFSHPTFELIVPSTKKKLKFRPMLVKEEKILLMAKSGEDKDEVLNAIKQVVNNCIVDEVDIDKFAIFDIEYFFLKIRAISINSVVRVVYTDVADKKEYPFDIDLSTVEIKFNEALVNTIKVNETTSITMKYPEASIYSDKEFLKVNPATITDELIMRCIDKIYVGDDAYDFSLSTKEERLEYVDNLDTKTYESMRQFLNDLPTLYHMLKYKNTNGDEREIVLTALNDFFTF